MIGGISIGSQIVTISTVLGLYNAEVPLNSILTTGKGGIIGVIIGVWLLAQVERYVASMYPMFWTSLSHLWCPSWWWAPCTYLR